MNMPAEAVRPLRERLETLRREMPYLVVEEDRRRLANSITETEALIKRLETSNASRHP